MGALIFRRDAILLVERAGEPLKGYWSIPGGLVETGESLADAIRREVFEETNLRVKTATFFELFERVMRDQSDRAEYHYVLVDYVCTLVGKDEPRAGDDVSRVEWVRRTDLRGYRLTDGTLGVIDKAFDARRRRSRV